MTPRAHWTHSRLGCICELRQAYYAPQAPSLPPPFSSWHIPPTSDCWWKIVTLSCVGQDVDITIFPFNKAIKCARCGGGTHMHGMHVEIRGQLKAGSLLPPLLGALEIFLLL